MSLARGGGRQERIEGKMKANSKKAKSQQWVIENLGNFLAVPPLIKFSFVSVLMGSCNFYVLLTH